MNIRLINSKANEVLTSFGAVSCPVDIEAVAVHRGLKVLPYPLGDDVSGLLAIENGIGTIGYNKSEPKVRRRFTIAHELGHYELHRSQNNLFVDKQFILRSDKINYTSAVTQAMEQEANAFASIILMPTDLVKEQVAVIEMDLGSEEAIKELAKRFDVSMTAMSLRISGLGLF